MPGRISCPILVGRQHELARISAFLAEQRAGPPSMLLVAGDAGIGKSRLLNAALSNARSAGWAVLAGSCVPFAGRTLPYGPMVEAVRRRHSAIDEPIAASLRSPLDALALGSDPDGSPGGEARAGVRARLFEALLGALERGAVDRPIVLAVEDLHWSDAATRDLLAFLIPNLASPGIAVMTTLRTDESDAARLVRPLLGELDRLGRLQRIDLLPLEPAGVSRMVAGILGREPAPELTATVRRRSGGNPLFVEELVSAGGAEGRLPPSLSEMLLARLASLPDETQDVLRLMAVIGERLSEPLLMTVSGMPPTEIRHHLRVALEAHVARRDPEDGSLAFRHALVREALYADLLTGERRELHELVAQALEHDVAERMLSRPGRQIAVALHWDAAGRADRSLPALIAAAEAAAVARAYGDALDLYRRCGELWDAVPPEVRDLTGTDRVTLDERIAQVASLAGDHEAAAASIRRAIAACDPEREPARVGVLHQRLSEYLWHHGAETEALEMAARSAELVPASGAPFERVRALCSWASALEVVGRYSEAIAPAEEAAALAAGLGDPSSTSLALAVRGTARANWDDLPGGVADMEAAVSAALDSSDPDDQAFPFVNGSWVIGGIARDHNRGLQIVAEWEALQRRQGLERTRSVWVAAVAGELHWMRGDWAAADAVLTAGTARRSYGPARLELLINAAMLRTWQGRLDEAEDLLGELDGLVERFVGQQFVGRAGAARVEHAAWRGDPEAALRHLAEARSRLLEPDDPLWTRQLYAVGLRACADRAERLQRGHGARELTRLRDVAEELICLARYEGLGNLTARLPETLTWAAQGRAELQRLVDEPSADTWGEVAAEWATIGLAYPEAYAWWRQAEASLRLGERAKALGALNISQRLAGRIGAGVLLDAIAGLARRARIRLDPVGPGQPVAAGTDKPRGLTSRELEVLALVARGLSNRQIASELFISEKTAGIHVSSILGKLDVPSRGQAAVVAMRDGLVDSAR